MVSLCRFHLCAVLLWWRLHGHRNAQATACLGRVLRSLCAPHSPLWAVASPPHTHSRCNRITLVPCPPPPPGFSLLRECLFLPIHLATFSFFQARRPRSSPPGGLFKCLRSTLPVSSRDQKVVTLRHPSLYITRHMLGFTGGAGRE